MFADAVQNFQNCEKNIRVNAHTHIVGNVLDRLLKNKMQEVCFIVI